MSESGEKSVTLTQRYVGAENRRVHMPITVHTGTVERMDLLCVRFQTSRGRLVDKLVSNLAQAYESGEAVCIHGLTCAIHRKDLPTVF
jgi:hypothetical protein